MNWWIINITMQSLIMLLDLCPHRLLSWNQQNGYFVALVYFLSTICDNVIFAFLMHIFHLVYAV